LGHIRLLPSFTRRGYWERRKENAALRAVQAWDMETAKRTCASCVLLFPVLDLQRIIARRSHSPCRDSGAVYVGLMPKSDNVAT
jgi:hypothetical protein